MLKDPLTVVYISITTGQSASQGLWHYANTWILRLLVFLHFWKGIVGSSAAGTRGSHNCCRPAASLRSHSPCEPAAPSPQWHSSLPVLSDSHSVRFAPGIWLGCSSHSAPSGSARFELGMSSINGFCRLIFNPSCVFCHTAFHMSLVCSAPRQVPPVRNTPV